MDDIFKALGDPTRLEIVRILAEKPETCVCELVDRLSVNQPTISHHMAKLRQAGLLNQRRQGQWIFYSLNIGALKSGPLAILTEIICNALDCCESAGDYDTKGIKTNV